MSVWKLSGKHCGAESTIGEIGRVARILRVEEGETLSGGHDMKNPAASVRARLLNRSKEKGEPLDVLMEQYATGRFLYRLANSPYRDRCFFE